MSYFKVVFRRDKWPVVVPMYQLRQCPECAALVRGAEGQKGHQEWHDWDGADETEPALDGYVIGSGPLPESLRAAAED